MTSPGQPRRGISRRRLLSLLGMAWVAPAHAGPRLFSTVESASGTFTFELFPGRAPITVANYLRYVDLGLFASASIYRIVGPVNQRTNPNPISVLQWGRHDAPGAQTPLPPIAHEPTSLTGLRHTDGTVSMARLAPGTATSEIFVCVGDQPALDEGGGRNPDGRGFAAFGRITSGHDVISRIAAMAEEREFIEAPIPIVRISRTS